MSAIPSHTFDPKHNNPVWHLPAIVPIERMDNSLALREKIATFSARGVKYNVYYPLGSLVFVVEREASPSRPFAIRMEVFITAIAPLLTKLEKSPAPKPHPKREVDITRKAYQGKKPAPKAKGRYREKHK